MALKTPLAPKALYNLLYAFDCGDVKAGLNFLAGEAWGPEG